MSTQVRLGLFNARIVLYVVGGAGALLVLVGGTQATSGENVLKAMLATD